MPIGSHLVGQLRDLQGRKVCVDASHRVGICASNVTAQSQMSHQQRMKVSAFDSICMTYTYLKQPVQINLVDYQHRILQCKLSYSYYIYIYIRNILTIYRYDINLSRGLIYRKLFQDNLIVSFPISQAYAQHKLGLHIKVLPLFVQFSPRQQ